MWTDGQNSYINIALLCGSAKKKLLMLYLSIRVGIFDMDAIRHCVSFLRDRNLIQMLCSKVHKNNVYIYNNL